MYVSPASSTTSSSSSQFSPCPTRMNGRRSYRYKTTQGWFLRTNSVVGVARNAFAFDLCAANSPRTAASKLSPTLRITWCGFGTKAVNDLPGRMILPKDAADSEGLRHFEELHGEVKGHRNRRGKALRQDGGGRAGRHLGFPSRERSARAASGIVAAVVIGVRERLAFLRHELRGGV